MHMFINNRQQIVIQEEITGLQLKYCLAEQLSVTCDEFYLICNGNLVRDDSFVNNGIVHIVPRILGGKGGFGSMLRAIGAQIEKTTNREACRDLSGRRLRDINEEQRLKNWINQQAEREKEAKERKKKKLERLIEQPKHEFKDEEYDKERSELPEHVEDAVLAGLQASSSSKRKSETVVEVVKKKKTKLWVDDELEDSLSSNDEEESGSKDKSLGTESSAFNSKSTVTSKKCIEGENREAQLVEGGEISSSADNVGSKV